MTNAVARNARRTPDQVRFIRFSSTNAAARVGCSQCLPGPQISYVALTLLHTA